MREWRVPRHMVVIKVVATAAFALVALWFGTDSVRFVVAALAAALVAAYALRDLIYPVRLAADSSGVTVFRGFLGRRQLQWGEIARIRVDRRKRLGSTTSLLEVDIDSTLFLFSKHELGAEPEEVADELRTLRAESLRLDVSED